MNAASHEDSTPLAPASAAERHEFLDVLRGVALLGIGIANAYLYSLYGQLPDAAKAALPTAAVDRMVEFAELWWVEFKFYTLFSMLFGVGFAILLGRAGAKGVSFHRFFVRRAAGLFLIGAAHAVLVWPNDILGTYAVCGLLLLPFTAARPRTVLAMAITALLAPLLLHAVGGVPVGALTEAKAALMARFGFTRETVLATYAHGGAADIVRLNLCNWLGQAAYVVHSGMVFKVYGCFLLGLLFGRLRVHEQLPLYRTPIRRVALWGLPVGLALNFMYARVFDSGSWAEALLGSFAVLPLSLAYAALLCLAWLAPEGPRRLRHFAPVGRMALTNYVGQSVVCTLVFNNTGLGLAGTMGPAAYIPLAVAVYALQVAASGWWLARYRFGPLEWLWRMATYGEWMPLARAAST